MGWHPSSHLSREASPAVSFLFAEGCRAPLTLFPEPLGGGFIAWTCCKSQPANTSLAGPVHTHTHSLFLTCSRALPSLQPCSQARVPVCSRAPARPPRRRPAAVPREHYARSRPPRNRRRGRHGEGRARCLCSQDARDLRVSYGVGQWMQIRRLCSHPAAALRARDGSKGAQVETQWELLETKPSESPEDSSQRIL